VLTLEYVTSQEMGTFKRLYSNLKDAFGYFGIRAVWGAPKPSTKASYLARQKVNVKG
jgi:hypothetical protein